MMTLDAHLISLCNQKVISPQEAVAYSQIPEEMRKKFRELGVEL